MVLRCASSMTESYEPRFIPSRLDEIERLEEYRPGGLHPIVVGDQFAHGRYRVIHKLGFGGSSTIWLARDQQQKETGRLVTQGLARRRFVQTAERNSRTGGP